MLCSPARSPLAAVRLAGRLGRPSSRPELALERGRRLLQRARVGTGGQVLPATVADDEDDVGPATGGDLLVGDAQRRVQDRAGRDAGEDALLDRKSSLNSSHANISYAV